MYNFFQMPPNVGEITITATGRGFSLAQVGIKAIIGLRVVVRRSLIHNIVLMLSNSDPSGVWSCRIPLKSRLCCDFN